MKNARLLIVAMAEQCRQLILECGTPNTKLPKQLQPKHLLWMCSEIEENAEDGAASKLHRWIGFIQSAMMAHRMLDIVELKAMFDKAKAAHGEVGEDLIDHLDPTSCFRVDVGGEG
jgi:hypothetical protein